MEKSIPAVSVIVPVYNVAAYIEKCARSLFEQTLENLEIIFVDDCSPDNSVEIIEKILEEYPNRKALTRIIRTPSNTGQAGVRSLGIQSSTGDYIIHLDGDDWVDSDYYKTLYDEAVKTDTDIVIGDEVMEYPDKVVPKNNSPLPTSGKDIVKEWYKNTVGMFCHNKLARSSLYRDNDILPWEGLNMWEDNGIFIRLFYFADRIAQVHGPAYHYNRCNVNAMTSGYGIKQVEQMIGNARNLGEFFRSRPDYPEFQKTENALKFLAKLNLITDSFKNYRRYKKTFPESNSIIPELDINAFSPRGQIRFRMVKCGLAPLFIILFKIKSLLHK